MHKEYMPIELKHILATVKHLAFHPEL